MTFVSRKKLLVVFESHMFERFNHLCDDHMFIVYDYRMVNRLEKNLLRDFVCKLKRRSELIANYKNMIDFIDREDVSEVYFCTAEGYIAHTIAKKLKSDRPWIPIIALQHGLFPLKKPDMISSIRSFFNSIFYLGFGYYPWGAGFGAKITDSYVVYNCNIKKYLVEVRGWQEKDVVVDMKFLKEKIYKLAHNKLAIEKDSAVLFSQCFYRAGFCSSKKENELIKSAVDYVQSKHDLVFIKNHPACNCLRLGLENVIFVNDLDSALLGSSCAYGFFSTALIDADICHMEVYSLYHPDMKLFPGFDSSIYKNFSRVISIK